MDKKHLKILLLMASLLILALLVSCDSELSEQDENEVSKGRKAERGETLKSDGDEPEVAKTNQKDGKEQTKEPASRPEQKKFDLPSFDYSWTSSDNMPDIVVIVDDFGNSTALLEDFAQLPSEVVFAVLPDLSATKRSGEVAAQHGHEVIIHVPMQAEGGGNPGSRYIKTTSTQEEIADMLAAFKSQLPMAIGANNHMGSAATADPDVMEMVLKELHNKGMFFMDSYTSSSSKGPALARSLGYPALKRDIFLDVPDNTDATINAKINSLGQYKGRREPVIIISHCHNEAKLAALQKFIAQIQGMGLRLTTLSRAKNISA